MPWHWYRRYGDSLQDRQEIIHVGFGTLHGPDEKTASARLLLKGLPSLEGSTANKSCKHLGIITGNCASLRRWSFWEVHGIHPNKIQPKNGEITINVEKIAHQHISLDGKIHPKHRYLCATHHFYIRCKHFLQRVSRS